MAEAKLEIKVGACFFNGEGGEGWLAQQSEKFYAKLAETKDSDGALGASTDVEADMGLFAKESRAFVKKEQTLAAFLKEKEATHNQRRKFLAAALWLQDTQGKHRVATRDVTQALSAHNQGRLSNASQNLIENTRAGWIVEEGDSFYVSEEGRGELTSNPST